MKVQLFNICNFLVDGGAMFGVVPKLLWSRNYLPNVNNLVSLALRSLVVETNGRVILFDTGFGDKQSEKFLSHFGIFGGEGLLSGLNRLGYLPEDITDVVHTHLHYDHCGGGVARNGNDGFSLVFPRAKYHISKAQWDWAMEPNIREADSFLPENLLPIRDLGALNFIHGEGFIAPGVEIRIFNGHTRGQMIPLVHCPNGSTLVFAADLIPTSAHLPIAWNMSYDVEPMVTMKEKEAFLEEALAKNFVLFYQHDYLVECTTLHRTHKGIRANQKLQLNEILH